MNKINDVKIIALVLHSESSGTSVDLSDMFTSLVISESIYTQFTTGNITLVDTKGLLEILPVRGDEKIIVSFTGSEILSMKPYQKVFDIYKIMNVDSLDAMRAKIYTFHLASVISDRSKRNKLRIGFDDIPSNMVKSICENTLNIKNIKVEDSKNKIKYIVPGRSPLQAISQISEVAQHIGDLESASYLFYEDKDNFNFKSIEHLLSQPTKYTFKQGISLENNSIDFYRLTKLNIDNYFDTDKKSTVGSLGSVQYTVDVINKVCNKLEKTPADMFPSVVKIESTAADLKTTDLDSGKRYASTAYLEEYNVGSSFQSASRKYVLGQLTNFKLVGETIGNSDIVIGSIADIDVDTINAGNKDLYDKSMSGKYIISAVKHVVTKENYISTIEFRKPTLRQES